MNNRPTVYVTQATPHDLAPASKFGDPVILLKSSRDQTYAPQPVLRELKSLLSGFRDQDYLLLVGDPVAMALAVNAAAMANSGRVRLLKWSQKHSDYFPVSIDLYDRPETIYPNNNNHD